MAKRRIRKKLIMRMFDMGITNKDLAEYIGIKPTRMSEYRHGYRKKLTNVQIENMCELLACSPAAILYQDDVNRYYGETK